MYNHNIETLIRKRRSVRTYSSETIEGERIQELKATMKKLSSEKIRFEYTQFKYAEGEKISTYGFIKGAENYIVGIVDLSVLDDQELTIRFGYLFEQIILKATDLGFSTCWMAGTFKADDIRKKIEIKELERIVMLSPIGIEQRPSMKEKLIRAVARSDNRKEWQSLFFDKNNQTPLNREDADKYALLLEMVQLAPSAGNTQPWRIIKNDDRYDFYAASTRYSDSKAMRLNVGYNDLGIAMAHFELSAVENNIKGQFIDLKQKNYDTWEYIKSWIAED